MFVSICSNRSGSLESLAGTTAGTWKLLACHTAPEFKDATANDKIKLGVLLGAGSFGRVYKVNISVVVCMCVYIHVNYAILHCIRYRVHVYMAVLYN